MIKKINLFIVGVFSILVLFACTKKYTVTYITNTDSTIPSITIKAGDSIESPEVLTKTGYFFTGWVIKDSDTILVFPFTPESNVTLEALWSLDIIQADMDALSSISASGYVLPNKGSINDSNITWKSTSKYVTTGGIVLPVPFDEPLSTVVVEGTFSKNGISKTKSYNLALQHISPTVIATKRVVDFKNLTDEYLVADAQVELFYEQNGNVPYIRVLDFFNLINGYIDPIYYDQTNPNRLQYTKTSTDLTISYKYYDEEEDYLYDLECLVDTVDNTISTNDPGFYWGYGYSTQTNYSRNLNYLDEGYYYQYGEEVVYELDKYSLDLAMYEGDVVAPFTLVNQLFAGSGYYNVYYNYDGLFGIYALPDSTSTEYKTMKTSSKNSTNIPEDVLVNTFNSLAFYFDYFYGLREFLGVTSYYDILYESADKLAVTNYKKFDESLFAFINQKIDEPHSSYGYPSFYNTKSWAGPSLSLSDLGPRVLAFYQEDGIYAIQAAIKDKWGSASARPDYWFLNDDVAVITLDSFKTSDILDTTSFDLNEVKRILDVNVDLLPSVSGGTRYYHYNNSSIDEKKAEILVEGLTSSYIATYGSLLVSSGYQLVTGSGATGYKANGYYTKTVGTSSYLVLLGYNEDNKLFYIGIVDAIPKSFSATWAVTADVIGLIKSDSGIYMQFTIQHVLADKPLITDIVLDITYNTGGNVGALYRVLGFITNEPFFVARMSGDDKSASVRYIDILNQEAPAGVRWTLLTSKVSFSAANELATIFKDNHLGLVIGQKSGGGACSITPILLPNGSAFTFSSNSINALISGSGTDEDPYIFTPNEFGVDVDYLIPVHKLYSASDILAILFPNT
jgi:uncharacterized repeat protein (TIGR02543 family)